MKTRFGLALLVALLLACLPGLTACSGGDDDDRPSTHTVALGGVSHAPGYDNPLVNCKGCHGSSLQGGSGPSCYNCHDNDDHAKSDGRGENDG